MSLAAPGAPTWRFESLGTRWEIDGDLSAEDRTAVLAWLTAYDAAWSRFRPDSLVTALGVSGGRLPLSPGLVELVDLYDVLADLTDGAVSLLVGDSLAALGYDASYSLTAGTPRRAPDRSLVRRDGDELVVETPAVVDIGAAGKGYAVDEVLALLRNADDRRRLTVDASGDLAHHDPAHHDPAEGARALRVALEDPHDRRRAIGVLELGSGSSLAASAVNRRSWGEGLHHVLDARTGVPVDDVVATWVVADSAMVADGAATALFFAHPSAVLDRLAPLGVRAAVRMTDLRRLETAGDLPGEMFT